MNLNIRQIGTHKIIAPVGEIDMYIAGKLKREILDTMGEKEVSLVLDLTRVNYIDSSGIALMIDLKNIMREQDGAFSILNLSNTFQNALKWAALEDMFEIHKSEEELK